MSTLKSSSLIPKEGRLKAPYQLGRKNYNVSAYSAIVGTYSEQYGIVTARDMVTSALYSLLTFTQDYPVWWKVGVRWRENRPPNAPGERVDRGYTVTVTGSTTLNGIIAADVDTASVDCYRQVQGVTLTNGVKVSGYLGGFSLVDEELQQGAGHIELLSASPQIFGPSALGLCTEESVVHQAVYIEEEAYTEAMRQNNNVITTTFGGVQYNFQIVGLYTILEEWYAPQEE